MKHHASTISTLLLLAALLLAMITAGSANDRPLNEQDLLSFVLVGLLARASHVFEVLSKRAAL